MKLSPQSAIWGRVTDANGQPVERVPVRLTAKAVRDGRKHWETRGQQQTDEDGRYRFANLMPGTYYVAAGPASDQTRILPGAEKQKTGYPSMYYPGVPDLASASPIQLAAGQQAEADFSTTAGPVYHVSGSIAGYPQQQGVGFQFLSQSGDDLSVPIRFNMETGRFDVDNVPPGNYIVKAFSQVGEPVASRRVARERHCQRREPAHGSRPGPVHSGGGADGIASVFEPGSGGRHSGCAHLGAIDFRRPDDSGILLDRHRQRRGSKFCGAAERGAGEIFGGSHTAWLLVCAVCPVWTDELAQR